MHTYYLSSTTPHWITRLAQILRPQRSSSIIPGRPTGATLHSPFHPPGEIWKHIFTVCVYSDLARSLSVIIKRKNRRFVRIEQFGLSGVVLYQIPSILSRQDGTRTMVSLEELFGSAEYGYEDGMSVSELLDCTNAKVVYFPTYACTSFIVGQVMHSSLMNTPQIRPIPAHSGFFVFSDSITDLHGMLSVNEAMDLRSDSAVSSPAGSIMSSIDSSNESEVSDQEGDASIDSLGPPTPPRFCSPSVEARLDHGKPQITEESPGTIDPILK